LRIACSSLTPEVEEKEEREGEREEEERREGEKAAESLPINRPRLGLSLSIAARSDVPRTFLAHSEVLR